MGTPKPKPYILGLSIGTFWLIAASGGFSIQSLAIAGISVTRTALVGVLVVALTLLWVSFNQIRAAMRLSSEPHIPGRRRIGGVFVLIVVLEVVVISVVNLACFLSGNLSMMVPMNLIIVGLHFLPLAKLFGVPRYTIFGSLFCAIALLTLILIPADAHLGAVLSRFLIPTLGCTAAAWFIAIANIREIRGLLK